MASPSLRCRKGFLFSSILAVAILLALLAFPWAARAWGPGHDDIEKAIIARLPREVKPKAPAEVSQLIKDSHYPDSFEPFEVERIGREALERLEAQGIKKRYDLHSDKGRAVAFLEMARAFREGRVDRAHFWAACLAHSAADMAACNHDPMVYTVTYSWGKAGTPLRTAGGKSAAAAMLDLAFTARDPQGAAILKRRIDETRLKDEAGSVDDAVLAVMMYGYQGASFCASRGLKILEDALRFADTNDPAAKTGMFEAMADLGAWPVVRALRDVDAARRLAAGGAPLELSPAVLSRYEAAVDRHMRQARLLDNRLYVLPASRQAVDGAPAIGVAVEPIWPMNDAFLGYAQRVLATEIANTLFMEKRAFRLVDIRQLLLEGAPTPGEMPVLILPAPGLRNLHWMKMDDLGRRVRAYLDKGGKVIWIGRRPPPFLIPDKLALADSGDKDWPLPVDELMKSRLAWEGSDESWTFSHSPQTGDAWQVPRFPYIIEKKAGGDSQTLLTLRRETGSPVAVGAAWPARSPRLALLPTFAVWPFVLTNEGAIPDPVSEAALDSAGRAILNHALEVLR